MLEYKSLNLIFEPDKWGENKITQGYFSSSLLVGLWGKINRDFDNWRAKSRKFKCGTEPLYIPNLGEYVEKNICVSPFIRAEVYYRIVVTYLHRLCMQVLIIVLQKVLLQVSACLVFKIHTQDLILSSSLETEPLLADIWYIPHLCRSRVP